MKIGRAHSLSIVSFLAFAAALVVPFALVRLRFTPVAILGVTLLASPFALLLAGHFLVPRTWWRQLVLALANVPLMFAWRFAVVAMWYFAPGLIGALVFGMALSIPAALLLFVLRLGTKEHLPPDRSFDTDAQARPLLRASHCVRADQLRR